jgi:hypothetical protein
VKQRLFCCFRDRGRDLRRGTASAPALFIMKRPSEPTAPEPSSEELVDGIVEDTVLDAVFAGNGLKRRAVLDPHGAPHGLLPKVRPGRGGGEDRGLGGRARQGAPEPVADASPLALGIALEPGD